MADRQFDIAINFQVISKNLESILSGLKKLMASTTSDINNVSKSVQTNIDSLTKELPKAQKTLDEFAKTIKPVQVSVDTPEIKPIKEENIVPPEGSEAVKAYNKELNILKNNLDSIMYFKPWDDLGLGKEEVQEVASSFHNLADALDSGFVPSETLAASISTLKFNVLNAKYSTEDFKDVTYLINKELKESANVVSSHGEALDKASEKTGELSEKEKILGQVFSAIMGEIQRESPELYNDIQKIAKGGEEAENAVDDLSKAKQKDTEATQENISANSELRDTSESVGTITRETLSIYKETGNALKSTRENLGKLKEAFPEEITEDKYSEALSKVTTAQDNLSMAISHHIPIQESTYKNLNKLNGELQENIKSGKLNAETFSSLTEEIDLYNKSIGSAIKTQEKRMPKVKTKYADIEQERVGKEIFWPESQVVPVMTEQQKQALDLLNDLYDKNIDFAKKAYNANSNLTSVFSENKEILGESIAQLKEGKIKVVTPEQIDALKEAAKEMSIMSYYTDDIIKAGGSIDEAWTTSLNKISSSIKTVGGQFDEEAKSIYYNADTVATKLESFAKLTSNEKVLKGAKKQIETNAELNKEWKATTDLMKNVRSEFKALPKDITVNSKEVDNLRNAFYKFRDEPTIENLHALQNAYMAFEKNIIKTTNASETFREEVGRASKPTSQTAGTVSELGDSAERAAETVKGSTKEVKGSLGELPESVTPVENSFSTSFNKVKSVFSGFSSSIKDAGKSAISEINSLGKQTTSYLTNNVLNPIVKNTKSFATEFKDAYSGAFAAMPKESLAGADEYKKKSQEIVDTDLQRVSITDRLNNTLKTLAKTYGVNSENLSVGNSLSEEQIGLLSDIDVQTNKSIVSIKSLGGSIQSVSRALRNMGGGISMLTFAIGQSITMVTQLGSYLADFSITATQVAANLDLQIRRIQIVSGEAYESIRNGLFDIANATGTAADQIAEAFRKMIFAGIDYNTTLEVLRNGILVATASAEDFVTVVKLGVSALNVFHKQTSQLPEVFNSIYVAASKSPAAVRAMANSLEYIGPVAASMGITLEQIAAVLTVLSQRGIEGCYDKDTEVLTKEGWKKWDDVSYADEFLTVNPKTKEFSYQKPSQLFVYKYTGKMLKIKNKHIDQLVTPNHNMFVRLAGKNDFEIIPAEQMFGKNVEFMATAKWKGNNPEYFVLPSIGKIEGTRFDYSNEVKIPIKDWVEFIAYFITEGSTFISSDGSYIVALQQKDGEKSEKIESCLKRLPFKYDHYGEQFRIRNKQLYSYLDNNCYDKKEHNSHTKKIPDEIKELDSYLLEIFYRAFALGDGLYHWDNKTLYTSSIKLRDDLEEIILKCGYGVSHALDTKANTLVYIKDHYTTPIEDCWRININKNHLTPSFYPKEYKGKHAERLNGIGSSILEEWIDYDDYVYCAEVPNHTLIVRRNGKVLVNGNSKAGTAMRRVLTELSRASEEMLDALHALNVYAYEGETSINGMTVAAKDLEDQMRDSRRAVGEYENAQIDLTVTQNELNTIIVEYDNAINLIQSDIDKLNTRVDSHQKIIDALSASYRNIERAMDDLSDSMDRYNGLLDDTRRREEALSKELEKRLASAPQSVREQYEAILAGQEKIRAGAEGGIFTSVNDLVNIKNQLDATTKQRESYEDIISKLENQRAHQEMILKTIQEQNKSIVKTHEDIIYSLEKEIQLRELEITSLEEQSQNVRDLYNFTSNALNTINAQIEYQNSLYEQAYNMLTKNNFEMRNGIEIIMDWSAAAQDALANSQKTATQFMAELTSIFGLRGVQSITALFDLSSMMASNVEEVESLRTQIEVLIDEMQRGGLQTMEQQILVTSIQAELNRAINETTEAQMDAAKSGVRMFKSQQEGVAQITRMMDTLNNSIGGVLASLQKMAPILLVIGDSFRTLTFLVLTLGRASTIKGLFGGIMANELRILELQKSMGGQMAKQAEQRLVEIAAAAEAQKMAINNTKNFWLGLAKPVDISAKKIGSTIGNMAATSKASLMALGTSTIGVFRKVGTSITSNMSWGAIKPAISTLGANLIPSLSKIGKLAAGEILNIWSIVPKMLIGGFNSLKFAFSGIAKMIKTTLLPMLIPLTPILAAIGAAIGVVIAYKKNWMGIQEKLNPVIDNFRWIIGKLWEGIKWLGEATLNVIKGFNDWIKSIPGLVTALKVLLAPITALVEAFKALHNWITRLRIGEETKKIESFDKMWDELNTEIGETINLLAGSKIAFDENGKAILQLADNVQETLLAQLGPNGFGLYANTLNNWIESAAEEYNRRIEEANERFAEGTQERLDAYKEIEAAFMKTLDAMSKYLKNTMLYADKEWQDKMAGAIGSIVGEMQNVPTDFIYYVSLNLSDAQKIDEFVDYVNLRKEDLISSGMETSEALVTAFSEAFGELTGDTAAAGEYIRNQFSVWASSPELRDFYRRTGKDLDDFLMAAILGIDGLEGELFALNDILKDTETYNREFANSATRLSNALVYQFAKIDKEFEEFILTYIKNAETLDDILSQEVPVSINTFVETLNKAARDSVIDMENVVDALEKLMEKAPEFEELINIILPEAKLIRDEQKAFKAYANTMEDVATNSKKVATGFKPIETGSKNANKHVMQLLPNLQRYGEIVAANKIAVDAGAISQEEANRVLDMEFARIKDVIDGWVEAGKVTKEEAKAIGEYIDTYIGDVSNTALEGHAALLEQLNAKYADLQKNVDDGLRVIDQLMSDGHDVHMLMLSILSGITDDGWEDFLNIIKNYPQLLSEFGDEIIRIQTGIEPFVTNLYDATEAIKSNENALRTLVMAYEAGAPWAEKYMNQLVPTSYEIKATDLLNRGLTRAIDAVEQFNFEGKDDWINGLTDISGKLNETASGFEKDLELIKEIAKISPVTGMTMAERLMEGANTEEQAQIMYEVTKSIKESANMLPDIKDIIEKMSMTMEHATFSLDAIVIALEKMGYLTEKDMETLRPYIEDTEKRTETILNTSNDIAETFVDFLGITENADEAMKNISDAFVSILTTGKDITKMSDEEFLALLGLNDLTNEQTKAVIELKDQLGYSVDSWREFLYLDADIQRALLSYLSTTDGINRNVKDFERYIVGLGITLDEESTKFLTKVLGNIDYVAEVTNKSIGDALKEVQTNIDIVAGQLVSILPEKLQEPVGQFIGTLEAGFKKISPEISYYLTSGVMKATEGIRSSFVELLRSLKDVFFDFGHTIYSMMSSIFDTLSKSNSLTSLLSSLDFNNINAKIGKASSGFMGNMMQQVVNVNLGNMNFPDIPSFARWLQTVINGLTKQMDKTASQVLR